MTHQQPPTTPQPGTADPDWGTLYRAGALCAALYVGLVLVPVVLLTGTPAAGSAGTEPSQPTHRSA